MARSGVRPTRGDHQIHRTRFPELGFVYQEINRWDGKTIPACWRFVWEPDEPGVHPYRPVGPQYRSKSELLADLDRYAETCGLS